MESLGIQEFPDEILLKILGFLSSRALFNAGCCCHDFQRIVVDVSLFKGVKMARMRYLEEALSYFFVCLKLCGDEEKKLQVLDERAICHFNLSNKAGALADLEKCMELASSESVRLCYEATVFEIKGQLTKSLSCSRKAVQLDPASARGYFEIAYVLQELPFSADNSGAIEAYSKCIELNYHRLYVAYFNRGWARECRAQGSDLLDALQDYQMTLELNPYFSQAARSICRLRNKQINVIRAEIELLQKAVEKTGESHLYVNLAYNYDAIGESQEALKMYTKAVEAGHPRKTMIYNSKGWIYERLNMVDKAQECYREASRQDAFYTTSLENAAKLLHRIGGDVKQVLALYAQVKKRDPMNSTAYHYTAMLLREEQKNEEALGELEKVLEHNRDSENIETHCFKAEIYCGLKKFEDAVKCYELVLNYYPRARIILKLKGHVLLRLGRISDALKDLLLVVELDTEDVVARCNCANTLFCLGRYKEAAELLEKQEEPHDIQEMACVANRAFCYIKIGEYDKARNDLQQLGGQLDAERVLVRLNNNPEKLAKETTVRNLLFCRQLSFENWISRLPQYLEKSPEYKKL